MNGSAPLLVGVSFNHEIWLLWCVIGVLILAIFCFVIKMKDYMSQLAILLMAALLGAFVVVTGG
jgi:hypothetical protein